VGLFILTFLGQNFVIPSGSMENTLLVGDHLVVDRITLAPPTKWMPLVHYREPRRNDIVVFLKPVPDPDPVTGAPQYLFLVKRLIGVPGDHIHLRNGIAIINGVAQDQPHANRPRRIIITTFSRVSIDSAVSGPWRDRSLERWSSPVTLRMGSGGSAGKYFMMGDNGTTAWIRASGVLCPGKTFGPAVVQYLVVRDVRGPV